MNGALRRAWARIARAWFIRFNPLRLDEEDYVNLALSGELPEKRRLGRKLYHALLLKPQSEQVTVHAVRFFDSKGVELRFSRKRRELAHELLEEWGKVRGLVIDQFIIESEGFGAVVGYGAIFTGQFKVPVKESRLKGVGFGGYRGRTMPLIGREEPFIPLESRQQEVSS